MEDQTSLFEFSVDDNSSREITELSRWSKLFGILVLSVMGIVALMMIFGWRKFWQVFGDMGEDQANVMVGVVAVVLCIVIAIVGIMMFFLIRSANRIRKGIYIRDQILFNSGLSDLKTFFVFMGIFSIIQLLSGLSTLF